MNKRKKKKHQYYPKENKRHKDRIFKLSFGKKKDLLDLYNAVNNTNYQNVHDLEVNTLDDAIFLSMKNDISFLIGGTMNLYEHQSTFNPNMPLRGLCYLARLYEKYVAENEINIHGTKLQKLPSPRYIIFFNGKKEEPDETIIRLTDAFDEGGNACLECVATMLNINYGHNRELMEKCRRLEEYALFVRTVRRHMEEKVNPDKAVVRAVDECIANGILKDILVGHRAEVISVILTSFNQEVYERGLREEAIEEGLKEGREKGIKEGIKEGMEKGIKEGIKEGKEIATENMNLLNQKLIQDNRIADLERSVTEREFQKQLMKEYGIE